MHAFIHCVNNILRLYTGNNEHVQLACPDLQTQLDCHQMECPVIQLVMNHFHTPNQAVSQ